MDPNTPTEKSYVFLCKEWDGEPVETEEMKPYKFKLSEIPYDKMWQPDRHWMPHVLNGKRISAEFTFAEDNASVVDIKIKEL